MKKNKNKIQYQKGAAMMIFVIFFMFISLTILVGIVTPTVREFENVRNNLKSKQTYYLSESGIEDAVYRLKNSFQIGSVETIVLGETNAVTTLTDINANQKSISSLSDNNSNQRKVDIVLSTSAGVSFNYGVQVGQGGINLTGSGTVHGNVYANGPITGDSSGLIDGSAISANSPSSGSVEENGSGTPSYNVIFGKTTSEQDIAQSFQVSDSLSLNKIQFYIKKNSSPSNATVKIVNDSGGSPGSSVITSGTLSASTVTSSYGWVDVSFSSSPVFTPGTTYWIVIDANKSKTKYYIIGASNGGYSNGVGKIGKFGGSWGNTTPSGLDYYFKAYIGGATGLIQSNSPSQWNPLHITDDAQANTVNYTNAGGDIYCQSGIYNNKSCISQPDPVYIAMPVSDGNITQWENESIIGGTYSGNYSVGWAGATLGPKKIDGNLSVSGGGTLNLTGPLWVTGNLTLNGGGTIKLDSSYSDNDGVMVVDGTISISGGGHATGSGVEGSYIMILSKSTLSNAITVSGGAGAVIVYAPNGGVTISGGASLKEAIGDSMEVSGGSSITYESGLANNKFSSGPSGSWEIQSWKESP